MNALLIASQNCHATAVKLLIEAGADLSVSDVDGDTPLTLASAQGCQEVVALVEELTLAQARPKQS
jgi:ankyrin repeat protein